MTGNEARKSFDSLWDVFVSMKGSAELPAFLVFHSSEVAAGVEEAHQYWMAKPMKDGSPRKSSDVVNCFKPSPERLAAAEGDWAAMFRA